MSPFTTMAPADRDARERKHYIQWGRFVRPEEDNVTALEDQARALIATEKYRAAQKSDSARTTEAYVSDSVFQIGGVGVMRYHP
jgi:hypothetical protein